MTQYHPDTDREIGRLYEAGLTPEQIADELAIPVTHVNRIAPNEHTRTHILNLWHNGIGKREISATVLLPLPTIQAVIKAGSAYQRRPPRGPDTSPGTAPLGRIERTLAEAEASPRQRTRQLAQRTRDLIQQIRDVLTAEEHERQAQQRIHEAEQALAAARDALRAQQRRRP